VRETAREAALVAGQGLTEEEVEPPPPDVRKAPLFFIRRPDSTILGGMLPGKARVGLLSIGDVALLTIDVWPAALAVAQHHAVRGVVDAVLGAGCGPVRSIYFDKPPGRTWSLPWHRDLTIAVRDAMRAAAGTQAQHLTGRAGHQHGFR
jgi:hypothetical protein